MQETPKYILLNPKDEIPSVHQVVYFKQENGQILAEWLHELDYEPITKSMYRRLKAKFAEMRRNTLHNN